MKAIVACVLLILTSVSCLCEATDLGCKLAFRPKPNETAFVAVGSALKTGDRICTDEYLIIPFDQRAGAVTLPKGQYKRKHSSKNGESFSLDSIAGDRIESCLWCDPLENVNISHDQPQRLCALSKLNVRSCASEGSLSFAVSRISISEGAACAPSLLYYGRSGNTLKFAFSDCSTASGPALTYDLNYGNVIRFLDERIEVLSADNNGIYFKRLTPIKDGSEP